MTPALRHRRRPRRRQRRAHARAASLALGPRRGARARRPSALRGRARHAPLGPAARGGAGRRPRRRGRRRRRPRRAAHARRGARVRGRRRAPAAMISASHNPFADNGIKLFAPGGRKLPDDVEERARGRAGRARWRPTAAGAGPAGAASATSTRAPAPAERYVDHLDRRRSRAAGSTGCSVVLDCANGAAVEVAPPRAAARSAPTSTCIHAEPDGTQHQRRLRLDPPRATCRPRSSADGADVGLALRRRRRPGARGRRRGRARRRRPDHRHLRHRPARPRRCCATTRSWSR